MAIDTKNLRRRLDPNSMNRNIREEEILELVDEVERLRALEAQSKPPTLSVGATLEAIVRHHTFPDRQHSWVLEFRLDGPEVRHGTLKIGCRENQAQAVEGASPADGRWRVCLYPVAK